MFWREMAAMALVAGVSLAGGALLLRAKGSAAPRYLISAAPEHVAWRIDTATGQVSACRLAGFDRVPICSDFGSQTLAEFQRARKAKPE